MPVHDWTRVEAGIFRHFHNTWVTELSNALNGELLPGDYYALVEQHAGYFVTDILPLRASRPNGEPPVPRPPVGASPWPKPRRKSAASLRPRKRTASAGGPWPSATTAATA